MMKGDERSLSEHNADLQSSLLKAAEGMGAKQKDSMAVAEPPLGPRDAYRTARTLRHADYVRQTYPLIDQATNQWREDQKTPEFFVSDQAEKELRCCDLEDEEGCPNTIRDLVKSRTFRRIVLVAGLLALLLYYTWKFYLHPRFREEWDLKVGFLSARLNGTYGFARGGDFEGTFVKELDLNMVPGGRGDPDGKRRLIFVGDIHGCKEEFIRLLEEVGYKQETDHLIATGDVISKGPDNAGVMDELIRIKADSVRGNHEDRILQLAKSSLGALQNTATTSRGYEKDVEILRSLKPEHVQYLRHMPLMIRIPASHHTESSRRKGKDHITEDIIVAHAGLVPHVPVEKQDPYFVMNMRSIDRRTHIPSALRQTKKGHSKPWIQIWNWYNDRLFHGRPVKGFHLYSIEEFEVEQLKQDLGIFDRAWNAVFGAVKAARRPIVVVYGHDSKAGLQIHRWSKGLDSACVAGGQLTALILDARGKTKVKQVDCGKYR